jgi:hypothetical protein
MLKQKIKIFNLSFPKTGTSSFIFAMKKFGLKTKHWDKQMCQYFLNNNFDLIFKFVKTNDVFADFPWAVIYKQLDDNFPNSKFILFERDANDWLNSCLNYFDFNKNPTVKGGCFFREYLFGSCYPKNNEEAYLKKYENHIFEVKDYFKNKKNFFSTDLNDKGWRKVCGFLGFSQIDFPRLNKSNE